VEFSFFFFLGVALTRASSPFPLSPRSEGRGGGFPDTFLCSFLLGCCCRTTFSSPLRPPLNFSFLDSGTSPFRGGGVLVRLPVVPPLQNWFWLFFLVALHCFSFLSPPVFTTAFEMPQLVLIFSEDEVSFPLSFSLCLFDPSSA